MTRRLALVVALAAVVGFLATPALAAYADSHDGIVVSAGKGKLVMTNPQGKNEHSHDVAATVKITRDGKDAKLDELKKGDHITVTMDKGEVTKIEAKTKAESK